MPSDTPMRPWRSSMSGRFDRMLFDIEPTALGGTYITMGLSDRWLELCRKRFARGQGINTYNRAVYGRWP